VQQAQGERYSSHAYSVLTFHRNYHIFYQICAGADDDEKEEWHIGSVESYAYLNQSNCTKIEGVDDEADFEQLRVVRSHTSLLNSNRVL
jgi:hypothetical protein